MQKVCEPTENVWGFEEEMERNFKVGREKNEILTLTIVSLNYCQWDD